MDNKNTRDAYLMASARAFANDDWQLCEMLDNRLERMRGQMHGLRQSNCSSDNVRGFTVSNTAGVGAGRSPCKRPEVSGGKVAFIPDRLHVMEVDA